MNPRRLIALVTVCGMISPLGPARAVEEVEIKVLETDDATASALEDDIAAVSLSVRAHDEEVTDALTLFGAARADYRQVIGVLYDQAYYGPSVSVQINGQEASEISPFELPQDIDTIVIEVRPGRLFTFAQATVTPRSPDADQERPVVDGFSRGEVAKSALVTEAINTALDEWRDRGHAKAAPGDTTVTARHDVSRLDVDVRLRPGPRLRFGTLTIIGDSGVKRKRTREMLGFPTGAFYSPQAVSQSVDRLRRAGAFRTVVLSEAETPNPDGTLDYTLTLADELPRRYGLAGEYSSTEGLVIGGFWLHRNVFGGAERFRIDAEATGIDGAVEGYDNGHAGVDYTTSFRLTRPAAWGPDNAAFLFGTFEKEDEPDYLEERATLGIGLNRWFSSTLEGETALGLRYSRADDVFGDREFNHVIVPTRLEWDGSDPQGDPLRGAYALAQVTPLFGYLQSRDLLNATLDTRAYVSGLNNRVTLAGRIQVGTDIGASTADIPPDYLFYSGGGNTVRGQRYRSLGAGTVNGETVGGRSFFGTSAELRGRLRGALGLVAFYDYGVIGSGNRISTTDSAHSGAGIGVRYATPIGPIRADLATPVEGDVDPLSRFEVYIGVGQAF